jgi:hypothetical protein
MNRYSLFLLLGLMLLVSSCVDLKFDEPPADGEPVQINPNATLQDLKAFHVPGQFVTIPDSLIVRAVVVADDRSGNFYKTLIIQDESAGIELKVNSIGLFNQFPIGRELFILCKGLVISDFNGLIQLGGSTYLDNNGGTRLGGIEEVLISRFLIPGRTNQAPAPLERTITTLRLADLSRLVRLDEVQFAESSANQLYADPVTQFSVNRTLEDCQKNTVILRSSGYADFAGDRTPQGKGSIIAVVGVFGGSLQLFIRDTGDVTMEGARCGQSGPGGVDQLNENFESVGNQQDVALSGWLNIAAKGTRLWRGRTFDSNTYVQATAFGDNAAEMDTWMITPAINLSSAKTLSFRSAINVWVHNGGSVLVSTDFDGNNPATATWTALPATLAGQGNANYAWVESGTLDLPVVAGKGYIAFRYTGSGPGGQTTSFIIDDVVVKNK